jgi:Flp pilus assembly pilin Flp
MKQSAVTPGRENGRVKSFRLIDAVLLLALALGALKTNVHLEQLVDIDGTDETQYLAIGLKMPGKLPDAHSEIFFAPLYSLWYCGLAQVEPEPIRLPAFNFRILGMLLPCALYGLLRRAGCPPWTAALAAFFLIAHQLSLEPATRSIHFAICCLAAGGWLALGAKTRVRQCCALALGATLAAFTRPEYALLAVLTLTGAGSLYAARRFREDRRDWRFLVGAIVIATGLVLWFGPPVGAGNDRSFLAFGQHFSAGYLQRHPSGFNPWWDFETVVAQVFDGAKTLPEAVRKNPAEFFAHISANLHGLVTRLIPLSLAHRNFLLPEGHRWQLVERGLLAGIIAVLTIARRKRIGPNLRWLWQEATPVLLFAAGAMGLATAGMVLTSTGDRYFLPIVFFGGFLFATLLGRTGSPDEFPPGPEDRPLWLGGFALMLVGLAPASHYRDQAITSTRAVLAELSRHSFRDGAGFVEAVGMKRMEIYLAPQLRFVLPPEKNESFRAFVLSRHIGAIHVTPYLRGVRNFAGDPEWNEFLAAPETFGFTPISLPFQETLFLRETALAAPRLP